MIPFILSQTWRSSELPAPLRGFRESWPRHNPELLCRLFTDEECAEVVAAVSPHHLRAYLSMPFPVMRADYFRYAVVFRDGGIYADVDMECLGPIDFVRGQEGALLSVEASLTRARQRELGYARPRQIANCIFAAPPGHSFFRAAMDRCIRQLALHKSPARGDVEDITGPRMLTRLYEEGAQEVQVLRQIHLMAPLHYPDLWPLNVNMVARHHCAGSWKEKRPSPSLARRWRERDLWPNPFAAGYLEPERG